MSSDKGESTDWSHPSWLTGLGLMSMLHPSHTLYCHWLQGLWASLIFSIIIKIIISVIIINFDFWFRGLSHTHKNTNLGTMYLCRLYMCKWLYSILNFPIELSHRVTSISIICIGFAVDDYDSRTQKIINWKGISS